MQRDADKKTVVYRDGRFELGEANGAPYLCVDGKTYTLSCHPYEPCLYITGGDGGVTFVHNAFDPQAVLEFARRGETFTSITGREYGARDFCEMAAFAAGRGNIGIEVAERVFSDRAKKKTAPENRTAGKTGADPDEFVPPAGVSVPEKDPFYRVADMYPDSAADVCLVKSESPYCGSLSHRAALAGAAQRIFAGPRTLRCVPDAAKRTDARALFAPASGVGEPLNFRRAFLYPPYPNGYTDADFERFCAALFPKGRDRLEIYEWPADWSDYFDEGREWWGTLCLTVYDGAMDRFAVILASATD